MLIAANLAIAPTGFGATGITHSMSHPCGARYGVPHGVANAINLPPVIEFNAVAERRGRRPVPRRRRAARGRRRAAGVSQVGRALADHVRELRARLGLPGRLSEVGVPEEGIPQLAEDAMGEGSTLVNPREPSRRTSSSCSAGRCSQAGRW